METMKDLRYLGPQRRSTLCRGFKEHKMSIHKLAFLAALFLSAVASAAQTSVLTQHNDNSRTGQNTSETILTPFNVNANQFGKLFSQTVNGQVYAQPLYVPNISVPGKGLHNVVFVATEGDTVYAFDADSNGGVNSSPLWQTSLLGANESPVSNLDITGPDGSACNDLAPQVGVTGTPVIDAATGTLYVEAKSSLSGSYFHRLHALDITSGQERFGSPVSITATVPGSGDGSAGGQITFNPLYQLNRPGLLLLNGIIYIAYASHCDDPPYHGWLFAYSAANLNQQAVFITTPNGSQGGIWMSGDGLSADVNGNLFVPTGNGTFETSGTVDFGDSLLKLALSGSQFTLLDSFTPFNQTTLQNNDWDLGSGGALLLPDQPGGHPHMLVQVGKQGTIYLMDRDNMTNNLHFCNSCTTIDTQIVQELQLPGLPSQAIGQAIFGGPVYWNGLVYFWSKFDALKSLTLSGGMLSTSATSSASCAPTTFSADCAGNFPPNLSVSANGATNGIVWALGTNSGALLSAHDAVSLSLLYSSGQNSRDNPGGVVKFSVPTVSNGKVYVGADRQVSVFGLLPTVQLTDLTRGGTNFQVGDSFIVIVNGPRNQPVTVTQTTNGVTGRSFMFGQTDDGGRFSVNGTWAATDAGSYTQVWAVGDIQANPVLSFVVSPTAQLVDTTRGGTDFHVGDSFMLTVLGPARQQVTVTQTINGVTGSPFVFGQTDDNGRFFVSGSWAASDAGTYTQVWTAGGLQAVPVLNFVVNNP
jgi:hypothetical protein